MTRKLYSKRKDRTFRHNVSVSSSTGAVCQCLIEFVIVNASLTIKHVMWIENDSIWKIFRAIHNYLEMWNLYFLCWRHGVTLYCIILQCFWAEITFTDLKLELELELETWKEFNLHAWFQIQALLKHLFSHKTKYPSPLYLSLLG